MAIKQWSDSPSGQLGFRRGEDQGGRTPRCLGLVCARAGNGRDDPVAPGRRGRSSREQLGKKRDLVIEAAIVTVARSQGFGIHRFDQSHGPPGDEVDCKPGAANRTVVAAAPPPRWAKKGEEPT
jgi:hypothetical protein